MHVKTIGEKKETTNLKDSEDDYVGRFRGRKERGDTKNRYTGMQNP